MNWFVVCTKPKSEKKVAEKLKTMGVTVYCPLVMKIKQWSDRKKKVEIPLFNSYIFVRTNEKERNLIFSVDGVVRYLFWLGKPAIVKDEEIEAIQEWLSMPESYEINLSKWQKGEHIILEEGVFKNQSAVVQEVNDNSYVLILESLGCILRVSKGK